MANTSRTGFSPVGTVSGSPWNAKLKKYSFTGPGVINVGDVVALSADGCMNVLGVDTGTNILGVYVGKEVVAKQNMSATTTSFSGATAVDLTTKALTAGQKGFVTSRDTIYEVEGGATAAGEALIGAGVNIVRGAGSTTTFRSGHTINTVAAAVGTSAVAAFKVIGVSPAIDNDTSSANSKVLVIHSAHVFNPAGVGI